MKKSIFLLALVASLALASCNGGASEEATTCTDSTCVAVDTTVVPADSASVIGDSVKTATLVK